MQLTRPAHPRKPRVTMALPPTWTLFGDDHLPHRLQLLARMIDRESARQLAEQSGLTLAEWRVLAYAGSSERTSAAEICAAFDVDRAEVSRAVARLVEAGLLRREPDEANRKRMMLALTDPGRVLYQETRTRRVDYFRQILAPLDPAERERFDEMLRRVALKVDELKGC